MFSPHTIKGKKNLRLDLISPPPVNSFGFDGLTQEVTVPHSVSLDITGNITISMWIYLEDASEHKWLFSKRENPMNSAWDFHIFNSNLRFVLNDTGVTGADTDLGSATTLLDKTWYHIAGVLSGTTQSIYINGVLDATGVHTGGIFSSTAGVVVGNYTGASDRFAGSGTQPMVLNTDLSPTDIEEIANDDSVLPYASLSPSIKSSSVLALAMNSTDSSLMDLSGNGNNGTAQGGITADGAILP